MYNSNFTKSKERYLQVFICLHIIVYMSSSSDAFDTNIKNKTKSDDKEIENKRNDVQIKEGNRNNDISITDYYENFFENIRQNVLHMTNTLERVWPSSPYMFPNTRSISPFEWFDKWTDTRLPLCDVIDRGDKYELKLEIPGIDKDKIDIRATKNSIRISAIQSGKTKDKGKDYSYSERSYKSFHRQIPFLEEILPSKITARTNNGILDIELPKKIPVKMDQKNIRFI